VGGLIRHFLFDLENGRHCIPLPKPHSCGWVAGFSDKTRCLYPGNNKLCSHEEGATGHPQIATTSTGGYRRSFFSGCYWALIFAHRARCAAAIFFRAARLIRLTGLEAWAGFAFALGFILPCAQRCFISRDIFLRAAALIRPRLRTFRAALGGRPTLRRPVELTASSAEIA